MFLFHQLLIVYSCLLAFCLLVLTHPLKLSNLYLVFILYLFENLVILILCFKQFLGIKRLIVIFLFFQLICLFIKLSHFFNLFLATLIFDFCSGFIQNIKLFSQLHFSLIEGLNDFFLGHHLILDILSRFNFLIFHFFFYFFIQVDNYIIVLCLKICLITLQLYNGFFLFRLYVAIGAEIALEIVKTHIVFVDSSEGMHHLGVIYDDTI